MPRESSIGSELFEKVQFLVGISKISKIFEKMTVLSREALLLYELSEREPAWRFTARFLTTKTIAKRARLGPRTPVLLTMNTLFREEFNQKLVLAVP